MLACVAGQSTITGHSKPVDHIHNRSTAVAHGRQTPDAMSQHARIEQGAAGPHFAPLGLPVIHLDEGGIMIAPARKAEPTAQPIPPAPTMKDICRRTIRYPTGLSLGLCLGSEPPAQKVDLPFLYRGGWHRHHPRSWTWASRMSATSEALETPNCGPMVNALSEPCQEPGGERCVRRWAGSPSPRPARRRAITTIVAQQENTISGFLVRPLRAPRFPEAFISRLSTCLPPTYQFSPLPENKRQRPACLGRPVPNRSIHWARDSHVRVS